MALNRFYQANPAKQWHTPQVPIMNPDLVLQAAQTLQNDKDTMRSLESLEIPSFGDVDKGIVDKFRADISKFSSDVAFDYADDPSAGRRRFLNEMSSINKEMTLGKVGDVMKNHATIQGAFNEIKESTFMLPNDKAMAKAIIATNYKGAVGEDGTPAIPYIPYLLDEEVNLSQIMEEYAPGFKEDIIQLGWKIETAPNGNSIIFNAERKEVTPAEIGAAVQRFLGDDSRVKKFKQFHEGLTYGMSEKDAEAYLNNVYMGPLQTLMNAAQLKYGFHQTTYNNVRAFDETMNKGKTDEVVVNEAGYGLNATSGVLGRNVVHRFQLDENGELLKGAAVIQNLNSFLSDFTETTIIKDLGVKLQDKSPEEAQRLIAEASWEKLIRYANTQGGLEDEIINILAPILSGMPGLDFNFNPNSFTTLPIPSTIANFKDDLAYQVEANALELAGGDERVYNQLKARTSPEEIQGIINILDDAVMIINSGITLKRDIAREELNLARIAGDVNQEALTKFKFDKMGASGTTSDIVLKSKEDFESIYNVKGLKKSLAMAAGLKESDLDTPQKFAEVAFNLSKNEPEKLEYFRKGVQKALNAPSPYIKEAVKNVTDANLVQYNIINTSDIPISSLVGKETSKAFSEVPGSHRALVALANRTEPVKAINQDTKNESHTSPNLNLLKIIDITNEIDKTSYNSGAFMLPENISNSKMKSLEILGGTFRDGQPYVLAQGRDVKGNLIKNGYVVIQDESYAKEFKKEFVNNDPSRIAKIIDTQLSAARGEGIHVGESALNYTIWDAGSIFGSKYGTTIKKGNSVTGSKYELMIEDLEDPDKVTIESFANSYDLASRVQTLMSRSQNISQGVSVDTYPISNITNNMESSKKHLNSTVKIPLGIGDVSVTRKAYNELIGYASSGTYSTKVNNKDIGGYGLFGVDDTLLGILGIQKSKWLNAGYIAQISTIQDYLQNEASSTVNKRNASNGMPTNGISNEVDLFTAVLFPTLLESVYGNTDIAALYNSNPTVKRIINARGKSWYSPIETALAEKKSLSWGDLVRGNVKSK